MLVTGFSWHIKSTAFFGGLGLALYLILVVVSLGWRPEVATGVYLAVGGGLVFASGIALSVFRETCCPSQTRSPIGRESSA